jgi:hypothetical protein
MRTGHPSLSGEDAGFSLAASEEKWGKDTLLVLHFWLFLLALRSAARRPTACGVVLPGYRFGPTSQAVARKGHSVLNAKSCPVTCLVAVYSNLGTGVKKTQGPSGLLAQ